jgi:hypothetical protein
MCYVVAVRKFLDDTSKLGVVDQRRRGAVGDDGVQFGSSQSPVERNENGAEPEAGKLQLERIVRIVR